MVDTHNLQVYIYYLCLLSMFGPIHYGPQPMSCSVQSMAVDGSVHDAEMKHDPPRAP